MYHFENAVVLDRRRRPLGGIGDWDRPNERGDVLFCKAPTLRQCLLHFVETLPRVAVDAEGRCAMTLQQLLLRDRIATALSLDTQDGAEPARLSLEDAHRSALVQWFEKSGPRIFGQDVVPINAALESGKLGKANHGDTGGDDRDETAALGGGQNGDRRIAGSRN